MNRGNGKTIVFWLTFSEGLRIICSIRKSVEEEEYTATAGREKMAGENLL